MVDFSQMIVLILIILAAVTLLQYYNYQKRKKIEQENIILKQDYIERQKLYEKNVEANQKLRQIRHDLKKQLSVIEELDGSDIDATSILISGKKRYMDALGVKNNLDQLDMNIIYELKQKMELGNVQMVNLLGNILDNAIEACERMLEESAIGKDKSADIHTFIDMSVEKQDSKIILTVSNSKSISEVHENNRLITVKNDKENHGHGVGIIKELAEKGNCELTMEDYGDKFVLVFIMAQVPEFLKKKE